MMKIVKIGFVLSVLSLFVMSCKTVAQNTKIESISVRNTYGRGGFTSITANKDSLVSSSAGGRMTDFPNFNKKINAKDWQKLVSGIDLSVLEKTTSGAKRGHYDGADQIFTIVTKEKEYELYNVPAESAGYKQLEKLKTNINSLVSQYK